MATEEQPQEAAKEQPQEAAKEQPKKAAKEQPKVITQTYKVKDPGGISYGNKLYPFDTELLLSEEEAKGLVDLIEAIA